MQAAAAIIVIVLWIVVFAFLKHVYQQMNVVPVRDFRSRSHDSLNPSLLLAIITLGGFVVFNAETSLGERPWTCSGTIVCLFSCLQDNNIRYVALNTLARVVGVDTQAVQRHRATVVACVKDADVSIRRRALELVYALVNQDNIQALTTELLDYLKARRGPQLWWRLIRMSLYIFIFIARLGLIIGLLRCASRTRMPISAGSCALALPWEAMACYECWSSINALTKLLQAPL